LAEIKEADSWAEDSSESEHKRPKSKRKSHKKTKKPVLQLLVEEQKTEIPKEITKIISVEIVHLVEPKLKK
jgi:hypothetical protein